VAPATADPSFLRTWEVSRAFAMPSAFDRALGQDTGLAPALQSLPKPGAGWRRTTATPTGLVNVTALLGSDQKGSHITAAWLKTTLLSNRDQIKHVSVGWTRELWVFVNGKLVFADKNLYGVTGASKTPDGRLSLQNGSFDLPLVKGSNHIVVVLDDNFGGGAQHFGWGLMMRLADTNGITLPPAMDMAEAKSTTPRDAVRWVP
jgi:hypothetical protein